MITTIDSKEIIQSPRRVLCINHESGLQGHSLTKNVAVKISKILLRVSLYNLRSVYLKIKKNDKLVLFSCQNIEIVCGGFECMFIF